MQEMTMVELYLMGVVTLLVALALELGIRALGQRGWRYHESGLKKVRKLAYPLLLLALCVTGFRQHQTAEAAIECHTKCGEALDEKMEDCGRRYPKLEDQE